MITTARWCLVCAGLAAVLWVWSSAPASAKDSATLDAISHLLKFVESSQCTFIRNDKEYTSREAAGHLRTKYETLRASIRTPEDFIEVAASRSLTTGQPYWVRCAGHPPKPSGEWLARELWEYRKSSG